MDIADWILEIDSDLPQLSTQKPLLVLESSFASYPNAPSALRNRFKNHGTASVQKKWKTRYVDNSCPPIYTYKKPHLPCKASGGGAGMPGPVVRTERPRELELASVFNFKSAIKPSRQRDFKTPVASEKKGGQI